ncbi:L-lactate permease, partial [Candidatus Sumerlaeota bacterium]|nr:L-lactate permease [Candidatus Sumerlaeota bacterium]
MVWNQTYAPIGGIFFSTAIAAIPIVVLLGLLGFLHVRAHWAALAGLFAAWVIAVCVFRMPALL